MIEIALPRPLPPVLAVGALLKNTVCVAEGRRAWLSDTVGNLDTTQAVAAFEATVERLCRHLGSAPVLVAHDLHPDFHSTRFAQAMDLPVLAVQHHHAHVAALAAEHGIDGPLLGLALDGFGLGPDRQAWGGELIWADGATWRRLGHLAPLPQPGGDVAAREPWRMAAAVLHRLGRGDQIASRFAAHKAAAQLGLVLERRVNCPPTSSCGRLFDAACGLLGVRPVAEFEGQAPMELEAMVGTPRVMAGGWTLADGVLDFLPLLAELAECAPRAGADLFHGTLIAGMAAWAEAAAAETGATRVALGGGCFFNKVLTAGLVRDLRARGLEPLIAERVSPGDPGLSLGQAWVAGCAASLED